MIVNNFSVSCAIFVYQTIAVKKSMLFIFSFLLHNKAPDITMSEWKIKYAKFSLRSFCFGIKVLVGFVNTIQYNTIYYDNYIGTVQAGLPRMFLGLIVEKSNTIHYNITLEFYIGFGRDVE